MLRAEELAVSAYSAVRAMWRQLPEGMRGVFSQTPVLRAVKNTMSRRLMSHDDIYCDEYYRSAEPLVECSAMPIALSVIRDFAPRTGSWCSSRPSTRGSG